MTLEFTLDEVRALHTLLCTCYAEQPKQTRRILDVILRQMREKEPSLLKTERSG